MDGIATEIKFEDLLGLPYAKGGQGPDAYDCYGLCLEVCKRAGKEIPNIQTPAVNTVRNALFVSTKDLWTKISKPEPFCLVAFRLQRNWHAGVVLPDLERFIHVNAKIRVTISQLNNFKWKQRLDGFYVFPTD